MGAIFLYLSTEATRKITAVLIFGRDTDASTHLFLKNAVGFLMTISSTTLILNVILNVAVPASSAMVCGCLSRDESESRKNYWCFLSLPNFPRGLPTQELAWRARGLALQHRSAAPGTENPAVALPLLMPGSPLIQNWFIGFMWELLFHGSHLVFIRKNNNDNTGSQGLQMQLFSFISFFPAGSVPQASLLELQFSVLGICEMVICFCKWSRVSVLNYDSVKQI